MEKQKRERAVNFTELEVRFLIDIALRFSNIIENKKTDAVTWKDKNNTWDNIATEFNSVTGSNRNSKVLRLKYDSIKRGIKQKLSKNKLEVFKTGGGAAVISPFTDYEEKLLGCIMLSVEGLPSQADSDNILSGNTFENMLEMAATSTMVTNDEAFCSNNQSDNYVEYFVQNDGTFSTIDAEQNTVIPESPLSNPKPVNKKEKGTANKVISKDSLKSKKHIDTILKDSRGVLNLQKVSSADKEEQQATLGEEVTAESFSSKWKTWNPNQLKDKKHAALTTTPKKGNITKDSLNQKIDVMTNSRSEVIGLQKQIAMQELVNKQGQEGVLENDEYRKMEEHIQVITNLNLQHQILLEMQERNKREGILREELLQLEIQNKALDVVIKERLL